MNSPPRCLPWRFRHAARLAHGAAGSAEHGQNRGPTRRHHWADVCLRVLQAVVPLDEATLQQGLGSWWKPSWLYQRGLPPQATYMFKHASSRMPRISHCCDQDPATVIQRIAQVLAAQFPDMVTRNRNCSPSTTPRRARAPAITSWQRAGERALQRSANSGGDQPSHQGTRGAQDPAGQAPSAFSTSWTCRSTLGQALTVTKGYAAPEVGSTPTPERARCVSR